MPRIGIGEGMTGEAQKLYILYETLPDDETLEKGIRSIIRAGNLSRITTHDIINFLHSQGKFVVSREDSLMIKDKKDVEEIK